MSFLDYGILTKGRADCTRRFLNLMIYQSKTTAHSAQMITSLLQAGGIGKLDDDTAIYEDLDNILVPSAMSFSTNPISSGRVLVSRKHVPYSGPTLPFIYPGNADQVHPYQTFKAGDYVTIWSIVSKRRVSQHMCIVVIKDGVAYSAGFGPELIDPVVATPDIMFDKRILAAMHFENEPSIRLHASVPMTETHVDTITRYFDKLKEQRKNVKVGYFYLKLPSPSQELEEMYTRNGQLRYDLFDAINDTDDDKAVRAIGSVVSLFDSKLKRYKEMDLRIYASSIIVAPFERYCKRSKTSKPQTKNCASWAAYFVSDLIDCGILDWFAVAHPHLCKGPIVC